MSHLIIAPVLLPAVMGALIILWMRNDLLLQRVFSIVCTTLLVGIGIYLNWLAASDQVHVYRLGNWPALASAGNRCCKSAISSSSVCAPVASIASM